MQLIPFTLAGATFALCTTTTAQTIRVPAQQPTIQRAIDAAGPLGFTVLVAPGTYRENIDYRGRNLRLVSEAGPDVTTIDGGAVNSVVVFQTSEQRTAVLEGFTIRNGRAVDGGGIRIYGAAPVIRGNRIVDNQACGKGAGISADFGSPWIERNEIAGNTMYQCGSGLGGGGIHLGGSQRAEIRTNWIHDNVAERGGGIGMWSGGLATIMDNVIEANTANYGGALSAHNTSSALVANNLMRGNHGWRGSAIYSQSELVVFNNTIVDNTGTGTIASNFTAAMVYRNNVIIARGAIGLYGEASGLVPNFANNDVWAPAGMPYGGACPNLTGVAGNISADPQFVDAPSGDYRLQRTSPCIDAGVDPTTGWLYLDFEGDPRRIDGNVDGLAVVDMGMDEHSGVRAFGTGCAGSGGFVPVAGFSGGFPRTDNPNFEMVVRQVLGGSTGALILGDSRSQWALGPLPFELGVIGMPRCWLRVSMVYLTAAGLVGTGPGNGVGRVSLPVPNDPVLRGQSVFAQWLIADPGPGPIPGVVSNGLQIEIL